MDDEVRGSVPRRTVLGAAGLGAASLLPLAAALPAAAPAEAGTPATLRFFTAHQAAVVDAATRRIAPGPTDDPLEIGHPGAAEANVVRYIDTALSMFAEDPPRLFSGGPWSDRKAGGRDWMADFTRPGRVSEAAWRTRIAGLQQDYRDGIALLDAEAGGDYTTIGKPRQDLVLALPELAGFLAVLFQHVIEGMYAPPEYGGNAGLTGWAEVGFPGDSMPVGYTEREMSRQQVDVVEPTGIVATLLGLLTGGGEGARQAAAIVRAAGRRNA